MSLQSKRERLEPRAPLVVPEELSAELVEILLEEIERGLLVVDARVDEPGRRVFDGDPIEDAELGPAVRALRLSMAELVDASPGLQYEIERVSDRLRSSGAAAASGELMSRAHLLDLARLGIETFFLLFPSGEVFELAEEEAEEELEDSGRSRGETYEAMTALRGMLRQRVN